MTKNLLHTCCALLLCALSVAPAAAATKSKTVAFNEDVTIGSTLVKRGTYKVTYDDQTNTLTISRNNKVVATAAARLEDFQNKTLATPAYKTRRAADGNAQLLTSVNLGKTFAVLGPAGTSDPAAAAQ